VPGTGRRADGLQDGLLVMAPEAHIVGRYRGGAGGAIALARESVHRLLAGRGTMDVILSINDAGAYGALAALEEASVPPSAVIVTDGDAEAIACQHIHDSCPIRLMVTIAGEQIHTTSVNVITGQLAGSILPQGIRSRGRS